MNGVACEHNWQFMETVRWTDASGGYTTEYTRIDRFFCSKCLERKEQKKSEHCRDTPEWYRTAK